jgi:hypothetical protein
MKSIAKEIVNEYKELVKKQNIIDGNEIFRDVEIKAKQHALTINLILDCDEEMIDERLRYFLNEELNILKRGNLI